MEKNLPIKFFSKRTVDEQNREGGGGDPPSWVLKEEALLKRASELADSLLQQSDIFERRKERNTEFIPAVLQIEVKEDAIAKSYRPDIGSLFNENTSDSSLIGFKNERDLLVKINNERQLAAVIQKLSQPTKYRYSYGISAIDEIKPFSPDVYVNDPVGKSLEIDLINFQDYRLNKAVESLFEATCKSLGVNVKRLNYSPELINFKLTNVTTESLNDILQFEAIKEADVMQEFEISFDDASEVDGADIPVKFPQAGKVYPTVGILDTGIEPIERLKPWLLSDKFTVYPDTQLDKRHGTFVAGVIVYSDELENGIHTGLEGCYIYDAAVMPKRGEKIDPDELIENIRRAIASKPDIRIWNLSLETIYESSPTQFSKFGIALDEIQKRFNVIIIKSAGNCKNYLQRTPLPVQRISVSADSLRALVVGSLAHSKAMYDMAEIHYPSPFSRVGKGPCQINKPELVHYGGNAGKDALGRPTHTGVRSFSTSNRLTANIGTSFSTPRVTAILAGIEHSIAEHFDQQLVKALAVHSARYPSELALPPAEKLRQTGYGIPSTIGNVLYNSPDEITLILQDTLEDGQLIEITDFPFPQSMIDGDGYFYGEIIVTLASSSLVDPNNGSEYCQSNVEVKLGTYDTIEKKDMSQARTKNEFVLKGKKNLLHNAVYGSRFKSDGVGDFARERVLINYGDKYQAIKKYGVNLEELTPANREKHLKAPKKWYLQVTGNYRDFIVRQAKQNGEALSQDFCVVITIRDKRKTDIYTEVTQLLDTYNFVHNNIRVKEHIRISS